MLLQAVRSSLPSGDEINGEKSGWMKILISKSHLVREKEKKKQKTACSDGLRWLTDLPRRLMQTDVHRGLIDALSCHALSYHACHASYHD